VRPSCAFVPVELHSAPLSLSTIPNLTESRAIARYPLKPRAGHALGGHGRKRAGPHYFFRRRRAELPGAHFIDDSTAKGFFAHSTNVAAALPFRVPCTLLFSRPAPFFFSSARETTSLRNRPFINAPPPAPPPTGTLRQANAAFASSSAASENQAHLSRLEINSGDTSVGQRLWPDDAVLLCGPFAISKSSLALVRPVRPDLQRPCPHPLLNCPTHELVLIRISPQSRKF